MAWKWSSTEARVSLEKPIRKGPDKRSLEAQFALVGGGSVRYGFCGPETASIHPLIRPREAGKAAPMIKVSAHRISAGRAAGAGLFLYVKLSSYTQLPSLPERYPALQMDPVLRPDPRPAEVRSARKRSAS